MSELVTVKIKGIVATVRYGTLESGDILRTDAAFAKHLVEDCGAAEYCAATPAAAGKVAAKGAKKKKAEAPAAEVQPAAPVTAAIEQPE